MEILNNSIVKFIVRQGSNSQRTNVVLESGELAYTTDQKRLFIGDGSINGGNITGNLFKGAKPSILDYTIQPAEIGDFGFSTDLNKLYTLTSGDGSSLSDWLNIGGVYTAGTGILISEDNEVSVSPLSAGNIHTDALSAPLIISNGRVSLAPISAGNISNNAISFPLEIIDGKVTFSKLSSNRIDTDALSAPLIISNGRVSLAPISAGNISNNAIAPPLYISNGMVTLSSIPINLLPSKTITAVNGVQIFVDTEQATSGVNPLSSDIVIMASQILLDTNPLSSTGGYSRGVDTVETITTGHYKMIFTTALPSTEYIPIVQIKGLDALDCQARVTSVEMSACEVKVINSSGTLKDANLFMVINY